MSSSLFPLVHRFSFLGHFCFHYTAPIHANLTQLARASVHPSSIWANYVFVNIISWTKPGCYYTPLSSVRFYKSKTAAVSPKRRNLLRVEPSFLRQSGKKYIYISCLSPPVKITPLNFHYFFLLALHSSTCDSDQPHQNIQPHGESTFLA